MKPLSIECPNLTCIINQFQHFFLITRLKILPRLTILLIFKMLLRRKTLLRLKMLVRQKKTRWSWLFTPSDLLKKQTNHLLEMI